MSSCSPSFLGKGSIAKASSTKILMVYVIHHGGAFKPSGSESAHASRTGPQHMSKGGHGFTMGLEKIRNMFLPE
ncbi:hypothetical protein PV328_000104 [Microctonus aethiopoides]|uniref:Uncharacterized protein n=1 Tax=Microctonus aethiopoides TaxID=144406 RepID=A0AA39KW30_9HYME|nr:hypothetical protein PV328_000104 [Microctonus aethiopoides]